MTTKRKRAQAPKRTDRHTSSITDKGRHSKGQRGQRYDRSSDRNIMLSGNYGKWGD